MLQDALPGTLAPDLSRDRASFDLSTTFRRLSARLRRAWANELAIDLGTSKTVIVAPDAGVLLNEPSVIALNVDTRQVIAVGTEAKLALGREGNAISVVRPIKAGVIGDFDAAELMLTSFMRSALRHHRITNPQVLLCAPASLNPVERRALEDAAGRAGAKRVRIVEGPIAAAIGTGFDIRSGRVFMIVDIGAGATDIAILGFGGPVHLATLRVGGSDLDDAIREHLRRTHYLEIGVLTAEAVKIDLGAAGMTGEPADLEVRGRDLRSGLPSMVGITHREVIAATRSVVEEMIHGIQAALEELSPEVSAGLMDSGIVLTGGASQLRGLAARISADTHLPVRIADSDLQSVAAVGACKLLCDGNYRSIQKLMLSEAH